MRKETEKEMRMKSITKKTTTDETDPNILTYQRRTFFTDLAASTMHS
jgi:hypothetical protein